MQLPINQILCGRNEAVLAGFPDECIDLTVTSPPYDSLRAYKGYDWVFNSTAKQLYRVTKQGGVVVWVVADATVNGSESGTSFRQALYFMSLGFNLHDTMIYRTSKPPMNDRRYQAEFEYMFVFSKGAPKTFNGLMRPVSHWTTERRTTKHVKQFHRESDGKFQEAKEVALKETTLLGNVWDIKSGFGKSDEIASGHPGIFPEKLAEDHILSWSNPGDVVLDPFVGSGTTPKMAIRHSRQFIGIDISPEYCELARRRISAVDVDMFVF